MSRPKILSLAATTLMLRGLLAGCAGRAVGTDGEQADDVGGKSGASRDANGKIAFEGVLHSNGDVYAIRHDRTGVVRLTDLPGMVGSPTWQPVD